MQSFPTIINVTRPMADREMRITVHVTRRARARIVLGCWLMKAAARVLGCGLSLSFKQRKAS